MDKVIAFTNSVGGVSVIRPVVGCGLTIEEIAEKDAYEYVRREDGTLFPVKKDYVVIDLAKIPQAEDDFFNAWELVGNEIRVNLDKAKEVRRGQLRAERKPLLEALDVEALRNLSDTVKLAEIEIKKQFLREVTVDPRISNATTTAELRAVKIEMEV